MGSMLAGLLFMLDRVRRSGVSGRRETMMDCHALLVCKQGRGKRNTELQRSQNMGILVLVVGELPRVVKY